MDFAAETCAAYELYASSEGFAPITWLLGELQGAAAPALLSPPCWDRTQRVWEHSCPHIHAVGVLCIDAMKNPPKFFLKQETEAGAV